MRSRYAQFMTILSTGLTIASTSLLAQSAPLVSGRVSDASTGAALGNVEIVLSDGARTTSAADGSYRLRAFEPGAATLSARRLGFAMITRSLTLANGQTYAVALSLTPIPVTLRAQRVDDSVRVIAPGTSVIDRNAIERAGARDLGELLRGQQGVTLVPRGGPGSPVTVSIRGSSADQVLVLVDGTPLNNPISGEADLSLIDPESLERVDIVRGAQSSRYGGQALGGVIVVTTRRPGTVAPQIAFGSGQWGDRRLGVQAAADRRVGEHALGALAAASWQRTAGNFRTANPVERGGGTTRRLNADTRRVALHAGGSAQRGTTTLDVRGDLFDIDRGMPGSIVQPSLTAQQTQRRFGATTTLTGSPSRTSSARASLGIQRQTGQFADAAPPFGSPFDQQQGVTSVIGSAGANAVVRRVAVTAGTEIRRLGVCGNGLTDNSPRVVSSGGAWFGLSRAFTTDRLRVDLGGGARADVGTLWSGAYYSPDLHVTAQRGPVRTGASWRTAFSAPSLGDLFFQEGVQVRANPALQPERVRGEWAVSVDLDRLNVFGTQTTIGVSAFRGDVDDLIIWSPDFRFIWSPNNFDVSRRGIDASLRIAMPSNAVALTLAGAGVDVRYRGAVLDGQVIYRPRLTGSATLDVVRSAFDAQLAMQSTGARRSVVGSDINRLPAFQLVQLRLARRVDVGLLDTKLRLSVENLFDQPVAMLLDYPIPGRTWSFDVTLRPHSRRAARRSSPARSLTPTSRHHLR